MIVFEGNIPQDAYAMEWRPCARFPDYEVSECGDVRRRTAIKNRPLGFQLRGFLNREGYVAYAMTPDGEERGENVPAYRLVAEAFLGPRPTPKHEVAHRNGSKVGCHYTDLRWATRLENTADMAVHGTWRYGHRNGRASVTDEQALNIRREYQRLKREGGGNKYGGLRDLAAKYGTSRRVVRDIGTCTTWRHLPLEVE
jgi:hypothetical protein